MGTEMFSSRKACREPGCTKEAKRSGFCADHYLTAAAKRAKIGTSDGVHSNRPKLTDDQVAEARRMRAAFKTQREIAAHFGVSRSTIQSYLHTGKGRQS